MSDLLSTRVEPQPPTYRRLSVFTYDPSLATELDTAGISTMVLPVIWEDELAPGPVGEYLEVIDYDPASGCFYPPVDLSHRYLAANDGAVPDEGSPYFHQQMVYAVAMTTIRTFEEALGRVALWAPHRPPEAKRSAREHLEDEYVQRLRICPHALREANAYYSPEKKALLFGYFPASSADPRRIVPGSMVFTCLSHDVVAHETTHALLDGLHPRFREPSNPDALAFHEAFADAVALLQHFTFPEALRHEIARTRGDLALENLLAKLGRQFGLATGYGAALRDALGEEKDGIWQAAEPDPKRIDTTFEVHARGAILVAALFRAFVTIYKTRVADLIRIATGGSGVLPAGAIHPDLANRLANEAGRAAAHVLRMCIRALDYCPPVDITFGDYLRALVTADFDLVGDDERGYRIAMIQAFRDYGLCPRDVRNFSVNELRWSGPEASLEAYAGDLQRLATEWDLLSSRQEVFRRAKEKRRALHTWLMEKLAGNSSVSEALGLAPSPEHRVEVHSLRPAARVGPRGQRLNEVVVEITQRRPLLEARPEGAEEREGPWFRGGCTLLIDLSSGKLRYCITKRITSEPRRARQRQFYEHLAQAGLRATYFGDPFVQEPFAFLHRSAGERG